jgi:type VI secretion system protein VasJ
MGSNINYDQDFETCKSEIGKIGNIDFSLIENLCKKLLKEKSKDMRLLGFLSFVYLRDAKWEMFADVFEGFSKLAKENFDAMFPDRERARFNAIKWISEPRYTETASAQNPSEADYPHITRLHESLVSLKSIFQEKFPQGSPFPETLFSIVQKWEKSCKPKPQEQASPTGQTSSQQQTAEPMETPKQAQNIAKKTAYFLIEKEPQKIMGYRLMRALRWDILDKLPPNENGKTQLAPPPLELINTLNNMITNKDYKNALDKAEVSFTTGANYLWFGLQKISVLACRGLGEQYKSVEQAILFETGFLIKRLPDILKLTFSDGTPFCDDATRDWLTNEISAIMGQNNNIEKKSDSMLEDKVEEEKKEAVTLASSGKLEAALDLLQNAIRNSSNERDNFRRSIVVCTLLMSAKQHDIALSILDSLCEKIQQYHLDKWDPELSVEAWSIMIKVLKAAKANKPAQVVAAMTEKQNVILSKISQINPKKAFSLTM